MNNISILIVEDNTGDIILVKEYLSEKKSFTFTLHETESLSSALELLSQHDFDIVLLDLSLPDSTGLETLRKLIAHSPEIPVIVLTGLQDEKTARLAVRYGAQDYLNKQFISPAILTRSLIYAIERKKSMQEKEELLNNLAHALKKIDQLEGLLPICVNCKKVVDEEEQWHSIEEYMASCSKMNILPLICPTCKENLDLKDTP